MHGSVVPVVGNVRNQRVVGRKLPDRSPPIFAVRDAKLTDFTSACNVFAEQLGK